MPEPFPRWKWLSCIRCVPCWIRLQRCASATMEKLTIFPGTCCFLPWFSRVFSAKKIWPKPASCPSKNPSMSHFSSSLKTCAEKEERTEKDEFGLADLKGCHSKLKLYRGKCAKWTFWRSKCVCGWNQDNQIIEILTIFQNHSPQLLPMLPPWAFNLAASILQSWIIWPA